MSRNPTVALSLLSVSLIAACGGSDEKVSISGVVADGYISGAKVCLDINANSACDAGEPSATTGANGTYTIDGIDSGDESGFPVVVEMPATAIDSDTGTAIGQAYVMSTPSGRGAFISPLTSLVEREMREGGLSLTAAVDKIKSDTGLTVDLFKNYIQEKTNAANNTETQTAYGNAHKAAQVLVNSIKLNGSQLEGEVSISDRQALQSQLLLVAKQALMSQGAAPDPTKLVGIEDKNTLLALLAAKIASAAGAMQDVAINFDLVQGGSPVRCGDPINLANVVYDHTTKIAVNPEQTQTTAGQLVDTRFYIANVMQLDANGNTTPVYMTPGNYQALNLAMMDFGYNTASGSSVACTSAYNTAIVGKVKPGTYTGISMTMGVPVRSADMTTKLNHSNPAAGETPLPLQSTAMNWAWQSGRKFMKVEFRPGTPITTTTATTTKWNVHIGSTGCAGDPTQGKETACTNANRMSLNFNNFNAASQKIVLDIASLFAKSDVTWEGGGAVGCMSGTTDPECPAIFKALGLGLTGANAGRSLTGADMQTVFKVQ